MSGLGPGGRHAAEHVDALTGAYALDALDDVERARVERHLRECEACREEVASFAETTTRLAGAVATAPPPALRAAVLSEVSRTRQLPPAGSDSGRRDPARWARWASAAAALLLAAGVGLGTAAWQWREEALQARAVADAVQQVLAAPGRQVVDTEFAAGRGTVVAAGEDVVLVTEGVPEPGDERDYQMWLIGEGDIRSAGLLRSTGDGQWWAGASGLRPGDVVGVTIEPEGGSRQPTSDPVMVAELVQG